MSAIRGRRGCDPAASRWAACAGTSSAEHNPFVALLRPTTTEADGEAYGFSLVYSGNFLAEAEVDPFATTRVRIGIHPDAFAWHLGPGETFDAPGGGPRLQPDGSRRR